MNLYEQIIVALPELADKPEVFDYKGQISLRNDSDGVGDYIERWDYSKSIPAGLKLGK
jgi:hypothetical protein